jgi:ABC-type multidrug transport system ATPase subunit
MEKLMTEIMTDEKNDKSPVVYIRDVWKTFGRNIALKKINLEIKSGEKIAILGPNGAGKTTLIRLVAGQIKPSRGELFVFGERPWKYSQVKNKIGVVSHNSYLYKEMTAYENLKFYGKLLELNKVELEKRIHDALSTTELLHVKDVRLSAFSRGMEQRLSIARSLLHNPELLILDEPTSGLDIKGKESILKHIKKYSEERTVILTTHDLEEASKLCKKAAILINGEIYSLFEIKDQDELRENFMNALLQTS